MTTREKNSAINISVPKELKEEFSKLAYTLWTNPANLIKILMTQVVLTKEINLKFTPSSNIEVEALNTSDWWKDFNKKSYELTKNMSNSLKTRKKWI